MAAPARGARGRGLSPRALRPQSRRRPQREQRPTRREPAPLSSGPRSVLGAGRRDCRRGVGQPGGSRGPAKTCLCWLLNSGVSPFLLDLAKCMYPPCSPGRELPGEVWDRRARGPGSLAARPLPRGTCPSVPVSRRGEGGEDGAARVPCPLPGWAPATACSLSGTLPPVRNRGVTPNLSSHSCFSFPPSLPCSAKKTQ